jgi:hypothetical protein
VRAEADPATTPFVGRDDELPPDSVPGAFVGVRMTDRTPTDLYAEPLLAGSPPGPVGAGR